MKLIDVTTMAEKLGSTVGSVYAKVSMRAIPQWCVVKIGKALRFDEEAVDKWLESLRQGPVPIMT